MDDLGTSQTFHIYPRIDYKVQQHHNVNITLTASLLEDGAVEAAGLLATVAMTLVDRDTAGFCAVIVEPTITTFDNM